MYFFLPYPYRSNGRTHPSDPRPSRPPYPR